MAADEGTRYGDLCRLCATKTNMILAVNIFESEGAIRQINKKIELCLPIQVHQSDELPKMICENCLYKLELFFDFRERSVRTEGILLNLFKDMNVATGKMLKLTQPLVEIEHSEMIMIHHSNQLLNGQEMHGHELDLSQLQQRDMIVENEIILSQQSVDISAHPLVNIDLNHHELSNEEILVDNGNDVRYTEENLHLIQQEQLLGEHYHLQTDLHVNMDESGGCDGISASPSEQLHAVQQESATTISKTILNPTQLEDTVKREEFNTLQPSMGLTIDSKGEKCPNEEPLLVDTQVAYTKSINSDTTNDWLHCNMCGKSFNDKIQFQLHYEEHFNKCTICSAVFTNRDALNAHRKEAHDQPKLPNDKTKEAPVLDDKNNAPEQPETFSDSDSIKNSNCDEEEDIPNTKTEAKRKTFVPKECKVCGKAYKTNYKLAEHMRKHTGEKPYQCSSCEKAFRSKIGLAQHEAKHTGQYDLSCMTCGKGFQCKSYLMVHQRVHSDVKPYPCTTCGRNFKTKQSLLDHTNRHLGVKPYICDICGRGFITKGLCKAHQKVHTGLDNRKYSCKICNKMFVSKSYLQTHLRIHTGEKPFMCEVCGKGFLTRVDLRIHSTMHTGEKSYVCEMCGKAFARRDALRCHRRSHTGERPYSCDTCGQTFTQFSPMAIHKRLHTGERPYTCEVCGKSFVSRSTMMSHSRKHVR